MKKTVYSLLALSCLITPLLAGCDLFGSGNKKDDGKPTLKGTYEINSAKDFIPTNFIGKEKVILKSDILVHTMQIQTNEFNELPELKYVNFDGGNHTITIEGEGKIYDSPDADGLFGTLSNSTFKNLNIVYDYKYEGRIGLNFGGFAPYAADSYLENINVKFNKGVNITAKNTNYIIDCGGFVGLSAANKIRNCTVEGEDMHLEGHLLGGAIGAAFKSDIKYVSFKGGLDFKSKSDSFNFRDVLVGNYASVGGVIGCAGGDSHIRGLNAHITALKLDEFNDGDHYMGLACGVVGYKWMSDMKVTVSDDFGDKFVINHTKGDVNGGLLVGYAYESAHLRRCVVDLRNAKESLVNKSFAGVYKLTSNENYHNGQDLYLLFGAERNVDGSIMTIMPENMYDGLHIYKYTLPDDKIFKTFSEVQFGVNYDKEANKAYLYEVKLYDDRGNRIYHSEEKHITYDAEKERFTFNSFVGGFNKNSTDMIEINLFKRADQWSEGYTLTINKINNVFIPSNVGKEISSSSEIKLSVKDITFIDGSKLEENLWEKDSNNEYYIPFK